MSNLDAIDALADGALELVSALGEGVIPAAAFMREAGSGDDDQLRMGASVSLLAGETAERKHSHLLSLLLCAECCCTDACGMRRVTADANEGIELDFAPQLMEQLADLAMVAVRVMKASPAAASAASSSAAAAAKSSAFERIQAVVDVCALRWLVTACARG